MLSCDCKYTLVNMEKLLGEAVLSCLTKHISLILCEQFCLCAFYRKSGDVLIGYDKKLSEMHKELENLR